MLHEGIVDDGRIKCTFSRVVSVLPGSETLDLNLNSSHYIMIGTGLPGVCVCVCVCFVYIIVHDCACKCLVCAVCL